MVPHALRLPKTGAETSADLLAAAFASSFFVSLSSFNMSLISGTTENPATPDSTVTSSAERS